MATQKIDILALGRGQLTDNSNAAIVFEANNIVGLWGIGTTYAQYNVVEYSGAIYRSKIAGNVGNQPDTSPSQWETLYFTPKDGDIAFVVNGTNSNILQRNGGVWIPTAVIPVTVPLVDGQGTLTDIFSWVGGTKTVAQIEYTLKRGISAGRYRKGLLDVLNDGIANVNYGHSFNSSGTDINAYLTLVWGGSSVHLQYTSGGGVPEGNALQITYTFKGYTP